MVNHLVEHLSSLYLIIFAKCVGYKYWAHKLDQLAKQYDYNTSDYVGAITGGVYGEAECMVRMLLKNVSL